MVVSVGQDRVAAPLDQLVCSVHPTSLSAFLILTLEDALIFGDSAAEKVILVPHVAKPVASVSSQTSGIANVLQLTEC